MYKKDLEKELKGETSGDFAKLVVALLHVIKALILISNTLKIHFLLHQEAVKVKAVRTLENSDIFLHLQHAVKTVFCFCPQQKESLVGAVRRDIEVKFSHD